MAAEVRVKIRLMCQEWQFDSIANSLRLAQTSSRVPTRPRRFGDVCGSARSWWEKVQPMGLRGVVGEKKFKKFPHQDTLARSYSKFSSPGPASSSQNVHFPCQDKENVIIIPRWKNSDFLTRRILSRPRHAQTYPAKWCLGKNAVA